MPSATTAAILSAAWLMLGPPAAHAQTADSPGPRQTGGAAAAAQPSGAMGEIAGRVTLACAPAARNCREQPYRTGLLLEDQRGEARPPRHIRVSADGAFAISVAPGTYTIISADTRGSCCLPVLRPIAITVPPGQTVDLRVRFGPGLSLPQR